MLNLEERSYQKEAHIFGAYKFDYVVSYATPEEQLVFRGGDMDKKNT